MDYLEYSNFFAGHFLVNNLTVGEMTEVLQLDEGQARAGLLNSYPLLCFISSDYYMSKKLGLTGTIARMLSHFCSLSAFFETSHRFIGQIKSLIFSYKTLLLA